MPNLFSRIVDPWYPSSAIGLAKDVVSVVHLDRGRGNTCRIRNAATFNISSTLIQPGFDQPNIKNPAQIADILQTVSCQRGIDATKTLVDRAAGGFSPHAGVDYGCAAQGGELQEVLKWKIERGFGAELEELSIAKERLQKDSQGRDRYLVVAVRRTVLGEYERLFDSLGWRAGLDSSASHR